MKDMFSVPERFEDFLYIGQVLQAEGIRMAIEAHRRAKPFCMGTLYWQIDDCWPVASWSSMDYYGRWKAQQYMAKKAFQPYMLAPFKQGDSILVYAISDVYTPTDAVLKITLMNFSGKILKAETRNVTLPVNSSSIQYTLNEKEWLSGSDAKSTLMHVQLLKGNEQLAESNYFFVKPKDLDLTQKPSVKMKALDESHIEISTDKLARFVWLDLAGQINAFSDNYFDLLPGEKKVLKVKMPYILKSIKVTSLADLK
jgi:beta-mannosidase